MDKASADKALFEFADVVDGLGVTWFLALGTCLGMVRDGGYIEGDNDIDLGVVCSRETLSELFRRLAGHGFKGGKAFLNPGNELNRHFYKYGVLLDVFFAFREDTKSFLASFDKVSYCGRQFNIPYATDDYLKSEFGDWRTPRPGKSRGPGIEVKEVWQGSMGKPDLIRFEEEIKELFLEKKIRAPIHLSRGNEDQLIEIFKEIKPEDWCLSTHRNHYHALLKDISPEWLRSEILEGRSMHIMSPEHKFFASAIVGGICPVAVGLAMGIKMRGGEESVYCFLGDMASLTGIFHETSTYAENFNLPVTFIIEDNGLSTDTPTREVWGIKGDPDVEGKVTTIKEWERGKVIYYFHRRRHFPHVGVGEFVRF